MVENLELSIEGTAPGGVPYPWLALEYGENYENQVLCNVVCDTEPRIVRSIPEWNQSTPTNQAGWFLLTSSASDPGQGQLSLWNPVSLQSIALPPLDPKFVHCIRFVFLTETPNHPDCVILLGVEFGILFCHNLVVQDDDDNGFCWTHKDYLQQLTQLTNPELEPRDFDAPFYGDDKKIFMIRSSDGVLLFARIEIVKPKTLVITPLTCNMPQYPLDIGTGQCIQHHHWVSCSGDCFSIYANFGGVGPGDGIGEEVISVTVLKLDFSDMSWKIVDTCPNVAFFIQDNQFTCYSAPSTEAGNRVYMLPQSTKWLYTYHIQENTIHKTSLSSLLPRPHFEPSTTLPFSYWVLISDAGPLEKAGEVYYCGGEGLSNGGGDGRQEDESLIDENKPSPPETSLMDLPPEMLTAILSCLNNPVHYLNFRATNKFVRSLLSPKGWRSIFAATDISPWLIIPSLVDKGVSYVVDPVSNNKYNMRTWWDYGSRIGYSTNGWLLIFSNPETGKSALRLYNPMTKSTICLPRYNEYMEHLFFTSSPNPYNCTVVGLSMKFGPALSFLELGGDDNKWYGGDIELNREDEANPVWVNQSNVNPVCFGGARFYFLVGVENLAVFVDVGGRYAFENHHFTLPCSVSYEQRFLVGFGDQLVSIYIGSDWLKAFLWEESSMGSDDICGLFLEGPEMVWREVEGLGNNNIYLSSMSCIVREPEVPEMGNRVYLPRFHQGLIVYYSFNTQKFHAGEGDSSVVSYYDTKEQLQSCWFEPSWY